MDKIYTIFHQSKKNQMQLFKISKMFGQQILKIGRALGPRWAACSLRSALAVWHAYLALYGCTSLQQVFPGNLALMTDILLEISLLSDALPARNLTKTKADQLVKRIIKVFEMLTESKETYEKKKSMILLLQNLLRIFILLKITKLLAFLIKNYLKQ